MWGAAVVPACLAAAYLLLVTDALPTAGTPDANTSRAITSIECRLQEIERRIASIEAQAATSGSPAPAAGPTSADQAAGSTGRMEVGPELNAIATCLAEIEERFAQYAQRQLQTDYEDETRISADELAESQRTILSPDSSVSEKLAAHTRLRQVRGAYNPQIVAALVDLALTSPDPMVRADVWRCFDGASRLPQLVPHMLVALVRDADPAPREEAADTLKSACEGEGAPQPREDPDGPQALRGDERGGPLTQSATIAAAQRGAKTDHDSREGGQHVLDLRAYLKSGRWAPMWPTLLKAV